MARIERSPNTVRAYAGDLLACWRFLEARGARWDEPSLPTLAARRGVPVEVLAKLLCHRSVQTTSDTYLHATAEDLRAALERATVLDELGAAL